MPKPARIMTIASVLAPWKCRDMTETLLKVANNTIQIKPLLVWQLIDFTDKLYVTVNAVVHTFATQQRILSASKL